MIAFHKTSYSGQVQQGLLLHRSDLKLCCWAFCLSLFFSLGLLILSLIMLSKMVIMLRISFEKSGRRKRKKTDIKRKVVSVSRGQFCTFLEMHFTINGKVPFLSVLLLIMLLISSASGIELN